MSKIPEVNTDIWQRIKKSGFTALALTCDTQLLGKRLGNERNRFSLPSHLAMQNFAKYVKEGAESNVKGKSGSGLAEFVRQHKDNDIDWSVIKKIKTLSGLPVFAKGIMCKEDARLALENGADGIYVSNHGARQLDTTPATIEILPECVAEVELYTKEKGLSKRPDILFDGGVRTGTDILKALAMGADTVWIGRGVLWALACEGQTGVEKIIKLLNDELKEAMLLTGCYNIQDIRKNNILYDKSELIFPKL